MKADRSGPAHHILLEKQTNKQTLLSCIYAVDCYLLTVKAEGFVRKNTFAKEKEKKKSYNQRITFQTVEV